MKVQADKRPVTDQEADRQAIPRVRRPTMVRLGKAVDLLQGGYGSKYDGVSNTYSQNGAPS